MTWKQKRIRNLEMVTQYQAGVTIEQLVVNNELSYMHIKKILSNNGVKVPPRKTGTKPGFRKTKSTKTMLIITELDSTTRTQQEIASEYGISRARVGEIYKTAMKHGQLSVRKQGKSQTKKYE